MIFLFISFQLFAQSADSITVSNNDTIQPKPVTPTVTFNSSNESDDNIVTESITNYNDTVILSFIKENIYQSPDSLYFNILKISNYTKNKIKGELSFSFPEGWNIISAQGNILELFPDDSAFIPVRLAINKESIGALAYILNATFKTENEVYSTNAYISIPGYSKWTLNVNKSIVYFNQFNEIEKVKIKVSNKGNVTETIKLEYKIGTLIKTDLFDNKNNVQYITLASNKDSVINLIVTTNNDLSYNDRKMLERNWKEASLEVKASTFDKTEKQSIWFKKLYSSFTGERIGFSSPLNIGITCSNLMSNQHLLFNSELFGTILFPKDRDLNYRLNLFGMGMQPEIFNTFDFNRQSSFIIVYNEKKFSVSIGDNVGGGIGISFSGRGVKLDYKIDKTSSFAVGLIMSKLQRNSYGGFLKYNKNIFNIGLRTGLGFSKKEKPNSTLMSASVGASFSALRYNHFSIDLFGSTIKFSNNNDLTSNTTFVQDTTYNGLGFALGYSLSIKNLEVFARYQNFLKSISNSGNVIEVQSKYKLPKNKRIDFKYERRKVINGNYYTSVFLNKTYYTNEFARALLYIPTNHSVTYGIGPYYNSNIRQFYDSKKIYLSEIKTYNPKLYLTANVRLSNYKSISGSFTTGYAHIFYKSENPSISNIDLKGKGNYSLSSTFSNRVWRLNISYNVGSITDLWYYVNYQIQYPSYKPEYRKTESIVIRPSYEKSFYENKVLLQFAANYAYYLPSKRENISFNLNTFFNFSKGWTATVSSNLFINSVEDEDNGRISSKDINVQVGIRKSFDIQQPRLKYYNLTIICFKDLNGNKIKDENEPPLPNIQVTYERTVPLDKNDDEAKINTNFAVLELITSPDGETYYGNIPEGVYSLNFKPLTNLKDLYNVNGEQQTVRISSNNTTYFVPFAETYKVKGKIIIERDEFSSEGSLSYEGIRVTATDPNGESYSVLTDKNGEYVLSVAQSSSYIVKVNQVFNDQFICERGEYNVHFNGIKVINLDFKFYEKKRKVNFDSAIDALYIFNSLNTSGPKTKLGNTGFKAEIDTSNVLRYVDQILDTNEKLASLYPVSSVTDEGIIFKIDLYPATSKRLKKDQVTLPSVVCVEENGQYRYFANTFKNYNDAKDYLEEIHDMGISSAKVVSFKDGKEISLKEAGVDNE